MNYRLTLSLLAVTVCELHIALLRVCVPAVAKVIGVLDQFTSRGLEVILRVSVVVATQSTKFVLIAVK